MEACEKGKGGVREDKEGGPYYFVSYVMGHVSRILCREVGVGVGYHSLRNMKVFTLLC